jgi:hypothetical protein
MHQKDIETGMGPVDRVLVMSREAFRGATEVWPCSYQTNACMTASSPETLTLVIVPGASQHA